MPRISIDIDLDEFDIDDLLDELQYRFDTIGKCGQNEILDFCKKIVKVSKEKLFYFDEVSIIDSSKIEYFLANHQHFSEEQLRNMLNNK